MTVIQPPHLVLSLEVALVQIKEMSEPTKNFKINPVALTYSQSKSYHQEKKKKSYSLNANLKIYNFIFSPFFLFVSNFDFARHSTNDKHEDSINILRSDLPQRVKKEIYISDIQGKTFQHVTNDR